MAALDMFISFNESLSDAQCETVRKLIWSRTDELLGARSEDARVRLVSRHIEEIGECLQQIRK